MAIPKSSLSITLASLALLVACTADYPDGSRSIGESCEFSSDCAGSARCDIHKDVCVASSTSSSSSSSSGGTSGSSGSTSGGTTSGSSGTGTRETCSQQTIQGCTLKFCAGGPAGCYYVANGKRFTCAGCNTGSCAQGAVDECMN